MKTEVRPESFDVKEVDEAAEEVKFVLFLRGPRRRGADADTKTLRCKD